jgi:hypothetical protein
VDRALRLGQEQAATPLPQQGQVAVRLSAGQEKMLMSLCHLLGLSARSLLNAALRYAVHAAKYQRVEVSKLKEFPRRLSGREVSFELTAETASQLGGTSAAESLPGSTVAGLKLLHDRILKPDAPRG